eukprot:3158920-Amphidinium_carterae.1
MQSSEQQSMVKCWSNALSALPLYESARCHKKILSKDLEQGVYTFPAVGKLEPDASRLAVVTGVGSLAGLCAISSFPFGFGFKAPHAFFYTTEGLPISVCLVVLYYFLNGWEAATFGLCVWLLELALRFLVQILAVMITLGKTHSSDSALETSHLVLKSGSLTAHSCVDNHVANLVWWEACQVAKLRGAEKPRLRWFMRTTT